MMSLQLNLLSSEKKSTLLNLARYLFIKELLELAIFTCAALAIMVMFGWFVLTEAFSNVAESAISVNRESPSINHDVRRLNTDSKNLVASAKDFYPLSPRLLDIIKTLPSTIKLSGININRTAGTVSLAGTAATRNDLLNYQTIVASIPWIRSSDAPASQLFQKENINFEIRGALVGFPPLQK